MPYKDFFLNDNKSGWKTRENLLAKHEPRIYQELIAFIEQHNLGHIKFTQKVWHFMNDDGELKRCLNCGVEVGLKNTLKKGYRDFCSLECANGSGLLGGRVINAIQDKYGLNAYSQHEDYLDKVKATKKEKYGDENYNNTAKGKATKLERYGDENYKRPSFLNDLNRKNNLPRLQAMTNDTLLRFNVGDKNMLLRCVKCENNYEIYRGLFNYRCNNNIPPCVLCYPIKDTNSIQEKILKEFVKESLPNVEVIENDRKLIKPFEIDVLIPSINLGIEFNGIYWHSDRFENDGHLIKKLNMCENVNIKLINIFEDEWNYKRNIVESILKNRLGVNSFNVYGRKCEIREVSPKESSIFLESNHIQGNVSSKIKIGLFYNNELVSLMTFGGLRVNMGGSKKDGSYEMYRFCNKLNTNVIGGFSKLLKYFIKQYKPLEIITYADKRYFTGDVYLKNNFTYVRDTQPNYFYLVNSKRVNRFKYRKDILVKEGYDPRMSEREIMLERGIHRIYDCGNKKYILKLEY